MKQDIIFSSSLLAAASHGDLKTVQQLIKEGATTSARPARDDNGNTALLEAAHQGHLDVVQWLLAEGGATIAEHNDTGNTALLKAAYHGHLDVVRWLLAEGGATIAEHNNQGATALLWAAEQGHLGVVQWLLAEGGATIAEHSNGGNTALLWAAHQGHLAVVQWLLTKGSATITEQSNQGTTALLWAAHQGHLAVVQWLLTKGSATITEQSNQGATALLWAAYQGHLAVVQWLLAEGGARITEHNNEGTTALLWAAYQGHLAVVQWLLAEGGARITEHNNEGATALLWAAHRGHLAVVQWLLTEGGATITEHDNEGATALSRVAAKGHTDLLIMLISKYVDATTTTLKDLKTLEGIAAGDCIAVCKNTEFLHALQAGYLQKLLLVMSDVITNALPAEFYKPLADVITDYIKLDAKELVIHYQAGVKINRGLFKSVQNCMPWIKCCSNKKNLAEAVRDEISLHPQWELQALHEIASRFLAVHGKELTSQPLEKVLRETVNKTAFLASSAKRIESLIRQETEEKKVSQPPIPTPRVSVSASPSAFFPSPPLSPGSVVVIHVEPEEPISGCSSAATSVDPSVAANSPRLG